MSLFRGEIPDRVPVTLGADGGFWKKACAAYKCDVEELRVQFGDDFRFAGVGMSVSINVAKDPRATILSPFGVSRAGIGYGQALFHPLANATLKDVHSHPWPKPESVQYHIGGDPVVKSRQYANLGGVCTTFWHDIIDLMGLDNLAIKMYEDPQVVDAVFQYIVDFQIAVNRRLFQIARHLFDIFWLPSDFGSQHGPMISPAMFQRFVAPHLRRYAMLAHEFNLKIMLHSCGSIAPLIPTIIDCGIDAIHPLQPCHGMDLARIKQDFGNRLVLNGGIDAQHTLLEGTPDQVRQKTHEVLTILKPGGRYIGGASHDSIVADTPVENVQAMFDVLHEEGWY
jgi:uroporphyrinogen decarboxylase